MMHIFLCRILTRVIDSYAKEFHALVLTVTIKVGPPLLIDLWNFFL